jgi:hypothetical protein
MGRLIALHPAGEASEGGEFVGYGFWLIARHISLHLIAVLTGTTGSTVNCLIVEIPSLLPALLPTPNATRTPLTAFVVVAEQAW